MKKAAVLGSKWKRIGDAIRPHYPIGRAHLYEAIVRGDVESFVLKDNPRNKRGVRLVNVESLEAWLDRHAAAARKAEVVT